MPFIDATTMEPPLQRTPVRTRDVRVRPIGLVFLLAGLAACSPSGPPDGSLPELSEFAEGAMITGRVVENITACEVDAVCYLTLEFADTTVQAVYGTGERPAPPCTMTVEVSDVAFDAESGQIADVVVSPCETVGLHLERITLR